MAKILEDQTSTNAAPPSLAPTLLVERRCGEAKMIRTSSVEVGGQMLESIIIRGKFANVGVPTANGNVYSRRLWENQIRRYAPVLKNRNWFGEVDHPNDGLTKLTRASHIIRKLWFENNKDTGVEELWGEAEVFPTKPHGANMITLLKFGCKLGISSRGHGEVTKNSGGFNEVHEGFMLKSFDLVEDPAAGAFPQMVESVREDIAANPGGPGEDLDALIRQLDPVVGDMCNGLSESVAAYGGSAQSTPLTEPLRLEEVNQALQGSLMVERAAATLPTGGAMLRSLMGAPSDYRDIQALEERLKITLSVIQAETRRKLEVESEHKRLTEHAWSEAYRLYDRNLQMKGLLEQAVQVVSDYEIKLYTEQKIQRHPQSDAIRRLVKTSCPTTKEGVHEIIREFRTPLRSPEEIESVGARIRLRTGQGGLGSNSQIEELPFTPHDTPARSHTGAGRSTGNHAGGVSVANIRQYMPYGAKFHG